MIARITSENPFAPRFTLDDLKDGAAQSAATENLSPVHLDRVIGVEWLDDERCLLARNRGRARAAAPSTRQTMAVEIV